MIKKIKKFFLGILRIKAKEQIEENCSFCNTKMEWVDMGHGIKAFICPECDKNNIELVEGQLRIML